MSEKILISPSILSADFSNLASEIKAVENGQCDMIHVDVMDGHFVPNLTIGAPVVKSLRKVTQLPLDVHLMIDEPIRFVEDFAKAGSDFLTIHVEACSDVRATLEKIKSSGLKAGISLRPKTKAEDLVPYLELLDLILVMTVEPGFGGQSFMPEMLDKVKSLRQKFNGLISVDGGISKDTAGESIRAGANVLVAGTAIFSHEDRAEAIDVLRKAY